MEQILAWADMMTHGEFLRALLITLVVAIAYGLAANFVLWPAWSFAWDLAGG